MAVNGPPQPHLPFNITAYTTTLGCEHVGVAATSKGLFQGDEPWKHSLPALSMHIGVTILMTTCLRRILRPLNQPRFVAEMLVFLAGRAVRNRGALYARNYLPSAYEVLAHMHLLWDSNLNHFLADGVSKQTGIILGPSLLQHFKGSEFFKDFHTPRQTSMMMFFEFFSIYMFEFIVGIQTDFSVIKSSGKLGWILGISAFALPNILSNIVSNILGKNHLSQVPALEQVATFSPITSFHVITILLDDVKLLNSEIGRLAISSSLISNIGGWLYTTTKMTIMFGTLFKYTTWDYFKAIGPKILYILFAIFGVRPIMYWIIRSIPEGKPLKEWQFCVMMILAFTGGLYTECLGYTALLGSITLGFVTPSGPPLGSGMLDKLTLFVTGVLVPCYFINAGNDVNVFVLGTQNYGLIIMVILAATVGKILAAVLPMKFFGVPNKDAFALGLILSSQGFFDVMTAKKAFNYQQLNQEYYTVITLMILVNAVIATPILRYIYDPSKRYINYKRRTIQHSKNDNEFRTLLCVYEEDDVFGLINVLKASNPTRRSPIRVYVLDLMELIGRITPIFINHQFHKRRSPFAIPNRTDRIIGAFQHLEMQHEGIRRHNFTAIAPYSSMHDEVCTLALDKSVSLLLVPSRKSESIGMRGVRKNILEKAPCSVGIVVDKKIVLSWNSNTVSFHVCVVFLGGPDAREALAYATRMLENPSTRVTVIRLIAEDEFISNMLETKLDVRAISELKSNHKDEAERVQYKEVIVKDGAHTIEVLRSIEDNYDFMLVGRRLEEDSPLAAGLVDWNYETELGIVGDVLASSDMKSTASVLVIQQQSTVEDLLNIDRAKKLA